VSERRPADDWFIVNVADAPWWRTERTGLWTAFAPRDRRFTDIGLNLAVLEPGQPLCLYHAESVQEGFLVLAGECIAVVEEQERRLAQWDFFHCPAGTNHVLVGGGAGPCTLLAVGARTSDATVTYPVSPAAARHGASVTVETADPDQAYDGWDTAPEPVRFDWPLPGLSGPIAASG
jgi:uncharacterized cupin superfamily protein